MFNSSFLNYFVNESAMTRNKILVAEDNTLQLNLITKILEKDGYQVCGASDGLEALRLAEEFNPDIILLDVKMPNMDGVETCHKLKENKKYRDTPVLFITAHKDNELIVDAFNAGAIDYISKPFSKDEIIARVRAQLKYREMADERVELIKAIERSMKDRIMGQLSVGLAHNFNNLLTSAMGYCQLIEVSTKESDSKKRILIVRKVLSDMHRMVTNIAEFTDRTKIDKIKINILDYLKEKTELLLKASFPNLKVNFESKIKSDDGQDLIEIESFTTCLFNIFTNSVENCSNEKPILVIEVSKTFLPENLKSLFTGENLNEQFLKIKFTDNGKGFGPEVAQPIEMFQPFWTTKKTVGVGLGLSVVHGFVSRHNGYVNAYNASEKGAVIEVYLPVSNI